MKRLKRLVSMFLMLTMIVTGLNLDGFVLEVKAEPVEEATYLGMMLTREEYQTLAYGKGTEDGDWWSFAYVDNRYQTEQSTVNEVLSDLKARENFFRTADEENYNSELVAINSGYYLVIAVSADRTAQTVTELDGTNGVVFGADNYKEDENVPDEEANWLPYTYGNLTVDVEAPVAFSRGCFSDITLNYAVDAAVSVNEAHIAGTIEGQTSNESVKSLYIGRDVRVYGLCGFDSERFFVQTGTDENDNTWKNAGMRFDSQTGEEPISFGEISCAVIKEDGTVTTADDNADKSWISLDILYHEGYVPTFTGASDLGISGEEENAWDNTIGLSYFESMNENEDWVRHEPQAGEQAVVYANANAWKNSRVYYNGTENSWNYQIDADGTLFDVEQAPYSIARYSNEESYFADYHSDVEWTSDFFASSASMAGILQILTYDSELNVENAYYRLNLDYRDVENADTVGELTIGALDIPAGVKGLRLVVNETEINGEFMQTVGVIDSIVAPEGTQLELIGAYRGTDGCIEISGKGEVGFWDVQKVDADILMTDDGVLSLAGTTVTGKVGTSPADGTIGTLKLSNWNRVGGIDSFKTVEYSEASINVKDNQGLVFYDITNGYDGSNAETAKGNLNITIEGAPTEETIPQFNKAVLPLGRQLHMAYDENENAYPVYSYEAEGMWSYYAKVGEVFYLINSEDNHFNTTTSEQAAEDVLTVLQGQEPNGFDCDIQLNYVQSMDAEEWQNVEFSEGDKVLKVPADNAAIAGNIYENVHYYNDYGLEKDIDGSLLSRELDNGIHISVYRDDPENEENTAEVAFENDYVREGWAYSEEFAYTSSDELANLWMEYLAEVKGYQYLRLTTNADNETDFGNLKLPASALGLGIYTEMNWDIQPLTYKQASIDSVTATADGQIVKIRGSYSKGFDFNKGDSNAILQLTGARVNGEVNARDAEVTTSQETVVSSLKNMRTLNLGGNLTIEKEMKFAADGQLNVTEPDTDGRLLAKAGASIELPDVNLIYNQACK